MPHPLDQTVAVALGPLLKAEGFGKRRVRIFVRECDDGEQRVEAINKPSSDRTFGGFEVLLLVYFREASALFKTALGPDVNVFACTKLEDPTGNSDFWYGLDQDMTVEGTKLAEAYRARATWFSQEGSWAGHCARLKAWDEAREDSNLGAVAAALTLGDRALAQDRFDRLRGWSFQKKEVRQMAKTFGLSLPPQP